MKKFKITNLEALEQNRLAVQEAFTAGRAYTVFRVEGPNWQRYAKVTSVTYGQTVARTRQLPAEILAAVQAHKEYERERRQHAQLMDMAAGYHD